ncbi:hypothetical protein WN51_07247 [Melipona quadrifasciata]|uniref:Uncharacterized protein n=1 Tax=Melipona quadrifasciata TaxID=166423 RepID=A0A0N0BCA9_9HYME|nr:hypothetical protein WN51_07247 [Melipona quadrifasciata]
MTSGEFPSYNTHGLGAGASGSRNATHWSFEPDMRTESDATRCRLAISAKEAQPLLADEVSHEETIADRPRSNVAGAATPGKTTAQSRLGIEDSPLVTNHRVQGQEFPSPISTFLRSLSYDEIIKQFAHA